MWTAFSINSWSDILISLITMVGIYVWGYTGDIAVTDAKIVLASQTVTFISQ